MSIIVPLDMSQVIQQQLELALKHVYVNPLEKCNLRCQICYTRKTSPILSNAQILEFIDRYATNIPLETITFCGGEVFALKDFPKLVNTLIDKSIFVQIITNGTLDRLEEISNPNAVNAIVSLDGLESYHDANRGVGNFAKSMAFLKKAQKLGFHTQVFSIVTHQNLPDIDNFETYLRQELNQGIEVTYHPRKPPSYLLHHPVSNIVGQVAGFDFLSATEMIDVLRHRATFPPRELGCYQVAVMSDGKVYGCCEGITPLGAMTDSIESLAGELKKRVEKWENQNQLLGCLGCSQAEFMCGIKPYLEKIYATTQ